MDPQHLSATLKSAGRAARDINLRPFETSGAEQVQAGLVPVVRRALDVGVDALSAVLSHYDVKGGPPPEVADLSFMARLELLAHQQQLETLQLAVDAVQLVSECGSSKRSLLRSTFAVDRALCLLEGLRFEGGDLGAFELQLGLRVRAEYARFRRDLLVLGQPELNNVAKHLELAGKRLGGLIDGDLFDEFRLDDRLMIHRLLGRVQAWLDGTDGRDTKSGLRLWQDLSGFVSLLVQVNHRTELVEHDRAVVRDALQKLFGGKPRTSVPPEVWAQLEKLYGRDDGVDGMLDAGLGQFAVEWREPLERLEASLGLKPGQEQDPEGI
ncbi:MAG: hypothetical protein JST54_31580 [Deltaproteobacteria bacterium]|nr:hypothetical protein [Deltaproteobacteria bacterium]